MLMPLADDERAAFLSAIERVKAWVQGGYVEKVGERFPEMRSPRAKRKRAAAAVVRK